MEKKIFYYILILILLLNLKISYAWWNPEWKYRQNIIIENQAPTNIPESFTINFTLNTLDLISKGKMNLDCSDLRIVKDDVIEIDRIVNNCNKNNTIVNFKLQNKINSTDSSYYVYYGSSNGLSPSENKSNVFYFFDDFENYNLGQTPQFSQWYSNGGNWKVDNQRSFSGSKSLFENGLDVGWKTINNTKVNVENFTYISYGMIGIQEDVWSFGISFSIQNYTNNYRLVWYYEIGKGGWILQLRKVNVSSEPPIASTFVNQLIPKINQWYEFKIIRSYPNIKVYINNSLIFDVNDSTYKSGSIGFSRYSNLPQSDRTSWYDDPTVMLYMEPWPKITLGEEESYNQLKIQTETEKETIIDQPFSININVYYNNQPLTNLTKTNFNISDNIAQVQIIDFTNYNNGSYQAKIKMDSKYLGKHNILTEVKYSHLSGSNTTQTILLTKPKEKILIITDNDWRNYIQAVSTKHPVLVYSTTRHLIDGMIERQKPDQIFIINSNLTFDTEHYYLDRDTLALIFFKNSEIIIPKDKQTAIAASMLHLPMLISSSQETLSLLNPQSTHYFNFPLEAELYVLTHDFKPTNYIVLVNPNGENAMFASTLAFKKNAYIIQSRGDASQSKTELKDNIEKSRFHLTKPFMFSKQIHLILIDVPHFLIQDPIDDSIIDPDGDWLKTDTPYGDLNDDYYLDISVGRLVGGQEQISYQLESKEPTEKNAIVIASYSTSNKLADILTAGSTMTDGVNIETKLRLKKFNTIRLVEKRSSYDSINETIVSDFINTIKSILDSTDNSYENVISLLTSSIQQAKIILTNGYEVVYAIDEFDWREAFISLIKGKPLIAKHLPLFTEENIKREIPGKTVIVYLGKGNNTHWFEPNITSGIKLIDINSLPYNPAFYYIHYIKGYDTYEKLLDKGAISIIASTGNVYTTQSSYVAVKVFDYFNGPVGMSLKDAKNDAWEFYKTIENATLTSNPSTYKKEYYTRNLIGDPSAVFDPFVELKQSPEIQVKNGDFVYSFQLEPKYSILSNDENVIYFHNASSFIFVNNMPIIPVYKNSILLPEESLVKSVSVNAASIKQYNNISIPISYPDPEYFEQENFTGQFPQNFYWGSTFELLDNRKIYDILFSPVIYFSNNSALIYEKINVELTYAAPIEITKIHSNDTFKGQPAPITLTVYSNLPELTEAEVFILVETEKTNFTSIEKTSLKKGINEIELNWPNTNELGDYSVQLVMSANNFTIGPRYTHFKVIEKPIISADFILPFFRNIYIDFSKLIETRISLKESIKKEIRGDTEIIDYKSWNVSLHMERKPNSSLSLMKFDNSELTAEETPTFIRYQLSSPEGTIKIERSKGMIKQTYVGNFSLLSDKMNQNIAIYNKILSEIK